MTFTVRLFTRKWPCLAVGFMNTGNEFVLHLYIVCFTIKWGEK